METSLISIGTHKLAYSITGTPQNPNDPLVVIIPGSADVASSYAALEPLLSQHAQILLYDRSGLGRSEAGPNLITAVTSAKELHSLLEAIQQQGPILLAAHSYGGLVAREFLHLHPERVCGMVLFETATENHLDFFQVPNPNIAAVLGNLKLSQITGLREDSVLTRDQWRQRAMDIARSAAAGEAEARSGEICQTLGEKKQYERQALGSKPLSVILCKSVTEYERIYEEGVEVGNGTEVQQRAFRKLLDGWEVAARKLCEEQLRLSSQNHFVYLPDCGHNVHLIRPDVVAEEIRWVLGMVRCRETQKL
jgi:pimeloyl-ACP methyl ester carboxylesterase